MERKKLKKAREDRGWSQDQVAEMVGVMRRETISDWERGLTDPYPRHKEQLCHLFGKTAAELDLEPEAVEKERTRTPYIAVNPALHDFTASSMTHRLLHIAHTDYATLGEMTIAVQSALKEIDHMNIGNPAYQITRREALCELASVPWIALGQKQPIHSWRYPDMLLYCTAALEACWQLYRSSDPEGTRYAFECTCTYVPLLESIAHDSSYHRKEALELAARYALLQTLLGWNYVGAKDSVIYARKALDLSKESGNVLLQMSAYPKLNLSYLLSKNCIGAWKTMREGEHVLKRYQRRKKGPSLPSGIIGNFYSSYCQAQIDNGIIPDRALGIAIDSEQLKEHLAFTEFTKPDQLWEAARIYCYKGDSTQAITWLGKLMDTGTLVFHPGIAQSETEQIGAINIMTRSLLQSEERDMGKIITAWTAAIERAKAIRHEAMFQEAVDNFEAMRRLWSRERAILKLIPLTAHWEDEKRRGGL
jgi:transcriptional regulator with XRE-family HTH domain